eukprot:15485471-Alexandrium_andersonii.AAC.1
MGPKRSLDGEASSQHSPAERLAAMFQKGATGGGGGAAGSCEARFPRDANLVELLVAMRGVFHWWYMLNSEHMFAARVNKRGARNPA